MEENPTAPPRWLDEGPDYYAAVTWNRDAAPVSEPPVVLGWMSDWRYAQTVPTQGWRGAMAIPRTLTLVTDPAGQRLRSTPVAALAALATSTRHHGPLPADGRDLGGVADTAPAGLDVAITVHGADRGPVELRLSNADGEGITYRVDTLNGAVEVDRSASGLVDFHPAFADKVRGVLAASGPSLPVRLVVDRSSVEAFFGDGALAMTTLVFPRSIYDRVTVSAGEGVTAEAETSTLRSVWPDAP